MRMDCITGAGPHDRGLHDTHSTRVVTLKGDNNENKWG